MDVATGKVSRGHAVATGLFSRHFMQRVILVVEYEFIRGKFIFPVTHPGNSQGFRQLTFTLPPRGSSFRHINDGQYADTCLRRASRARQNWLSAVAPQFKLGQYPQLEPIRIDRFGDVIGGAHLQPPGFVFRLRQGRNNDDRDVRGERVKLEPAQYLIAIHTGHIDVEQNQVRLRLACRQFQRLFPTGHGGDGIGVAQDARHRMQVFTRVIHDQYPEFVFAIFCHG